MGAKTSRRQETNQLSEQWASGNQLQIPQAFNRPVDGAGHPDGSIEAQTETLIAGRERFTLQ
jgi:hypothetical protein